MHSEHLNFAWILEVLPIQIFAILQPNVIKTKINTS